MSTNVIPSLLQPLVGGFASSELQNPEEIWEIKISHRKQLSNLAK